MCSLRVGAVLPQLVMAAAFHFAQRLCGRPLWRGCVLVRALAALVH